MAIERSTIDAFTQQYGGNFLETAPFGYEYVTSAITPAADKKFCGFITLAATRITMTGNDAGGDALTNVDFAAGLRVAYFFESADITVVSGALLAIKLEP